MVIIARAMSLQYSRSVRSSLSSRSRGVRPLSPAPSGPNQLFISRSFPTQWTAGPGSLREHNACTQGDAGSQLDRPGQRARSLPLLFLYPVLIRIANLSANVGEYFMTSPRLILCQIGRMTLSLPTSRCASPLDSTRGQCFSKNDGLRTTTPNRDFAKSMVD